MMDYPTIVLVSGSAEIAFGKQQSMKKRSSVGRSNSMGKIADCSFD
jgi:hypothetical protein